MKTATRVKSKSAASGRRDDLAFRLFLLTDKKVKKQIEQCKKDHENGDLLNPRAVFAHK
jgi:hypothetical protein